MPERIPLLARLLDDEVVQILRARLGPEGIADLVEQIINPYKKLSTEEEARLARVTASGMRQRKRAKQ